MIVVVRDVLGTVEKFPSPGKAPDGVKMPLDEVLCPSDDAVSRFSLTDS